MALPSHMSHNFSQVPAPQLPRSKFDRSSTHKTAFNSADLVPVFVDEILPGDTVSMIATFMARLSTFIYPIMDNIFFDTFFFFVPARILWENWEGFNGMSTTAGVSGDDFLIPTLYDPDQSYMDFIEGSIYDYMGLPINVHIPNSEPINALPFRAYNLIWNDWFRDQNLQDEVFVANDDGPDTLGYYQILKRGKRHDYFTSCLPYPQKGDSVGIPLSGTAAVVGDGYALGMDPSGANTSPTSPNYYPLQGQYDSGGDMRLDLFHLSTDKTAGTSSSGGLVYPSETFIGLTTNPDHSHLLTDFSSGSITATINQLRQAFAYQKVLERDARGGTRYVEYLKSHWGVTSPDFRLQRPEYLGGSSQRINVSPVPQTSETATTDQAKLAAFSIGHNQCSWMRSFVEHGYVLGLANVRSDITYQAGIRKLWSRQTRFDFPLPALMHLGEQAVLNKEIFWSSATPGAGQGPDDVFGYQERWAEYRYFPSMVTGDMRSNDVLGSGSLDSWHLATSFGHPTSALPPPLNATFIEDAPPISRVVALSQAEAPQIIMDSYFKMTHTRVMPTYSVPGFIDRF